MGRACLSQNKTFNLFQDTKNAAFNGQRYPHVWKPGNHNETGYISTCINVDSTCYTVTVVPSGHYYQLADISFGPLSRKIWKVYRIGFPRQAGPVCRGSHPTLQHDILPTLEDDGIYVVWFRYRSDHDTHSSLVSHGSRRQAVRHG